MLRCDAACCVQIAGLAYSAESRFSQTAQVACLLLLDHALQSAQAAQLDAVFRKPVEQTQADTNADRSAIKQVQLLSKMALDQTPLPSWVPLQVSRPNSNGVSIADCIRALCR